MKTEIASAVMRELVSRGYAADGTAPNGTMDLDEGYMSSIELGDLSRPARRAPREDLQIR